MMLFWDSDKKNWGDLDPWVEEEKTVTEAVILTCSCKMDEIGLHGGAATLLFFLCRGIHFTCATVGNPYLFPGNDWSKYILPG